MSIEREAAAGLKWSSIGKIAGQLLSWCVTLAVFRLLTPGDYGLMALSMVLMSILAGVAEFGLGSSLIQASKLDERDISRIAGALAALNIGCGLVIALGAPVFAEFLGDVRLTGILQVLSLQFLLTAIETMPRSLAYRGMLFKRLAGIELAGTSLGATGTLLLAWWGAGVWALVAGVLLGASLRTALFVSFGGFVWPSFDLRGVGPHLRFGGAVTASRFLWLITYQADMLIAGRLFTRDVVGLYSVSMHLATLPMTKGMGIINQVAFPAVARLQDQVPRLRQRLLEALRLLALVAIPTMWGMSAIGPEFVDVVLGENWHPAVAALQIVSFVTPLRMLAAVLSTALTGVGRADLELSNMLIAAFVLPIAFFIGARVSLNALALSWVVAIPIVFILNFPRTLPALGLRFSELIAAVHGPVIAGIAMYALIVAVRMPLTNMEEVKRLPILILAGAAGYLITIRVVDRSVWKDVWKLAGALRG